MTAKGRCGCAVPEDAAGAWAEVGEVPCILEGMVNFEAEVSLIAARGRSGQVVFYPLIENHHREGILRTSIAPFVHEELQRQAESYLNVLLEKLEYVGVLAVEFFVVDGALLANEMAPRVHNSGHWTIEGSETSQFENHLRAIAGMELGDTTSRPTVMLNCIGSMPSESRDGGVSRAISPRLREGSAARTQGGTSYLPGVRARGDCRMAAAAAGLISTSRRPARCTSWTSERASCCCAASSVSCEL